MKTTHGTGEKRAARRTGGDLLQTTEEEKRGESVARRGMDILKRLAFKEGGEGEAKKEAVAKVGFAMTLKKKKRDNRVRFTEQYHGRGRDIDRKEREGLARKKRGWRRLDAGPSEHLRNRAAIMMPEEGAKARLERWTGGEKGAEKNYS